MTFQETVKTEDCYVREPQVMESSVKRSSHKSLTPSKIVLSPNNNQLSETKFKLVSLTREKSIPEFSEDGKSDETRSAYRESTGKKSEGLSNTTTSVVVISSRNQLYPNNKMLESSKKNLSFKECSKGTMSSYYLREEDSQEERRLLSEIQKID